MSHKAMVKVLTARSGPRFSSADFETDGNFLHEDRVNLRQVQMWLRAMAPQDDRGSIYLVYPKGIITSIIHLSVEMFKLPMIFFGKMCFTLLKPQTTKRVFSTGASEKVACNSREGRGGGHQGRALGGHGIRVRGPP